MAIASVVLGVSISFFARPRPAGGTMLGKRDCFATHRSLKGEKFGKISF
jgi:hypothetical protein